MNPESTNAPLQGSETTNTTQGLRIVSVNFGTPAAQTWFGELPNLATTVPQISDIPDARRQLDKANMLVQAAQKAEGMLTIIRDGLTGRGFDVSTPVDPRRGAWPPILAAAADVADLAKSLTAEVERLRRELDEATRQRECAKQARINDTNAAKSAIDDLEKEIRELRETVAKQQGRYEELTRRKQPPKQVAASATSAPTDSAPVGPGGLKKKPTVPDAGGKKPKPTTAAASQADFNPEGLSPTHLVLAAEHFLQRMLVSNQAQWEAFVASLDVPTKVKFGVVLALMQFMAVTPLEGDVPDAFKASGLARLVAERLDVLAAVPEADGRLRLWTEEHTRALRPSGAEGAPAKGKPAKVVLQNLVATARGGGPITDAAIDALWTRLHGMMNMLVGMLATAKTAAAAAAADSAPRTVYATSLNNMVAVVCASFDMLKLDQVPVSQWNRAFMDSMRAVSAGSKKRIGEVERTDRGPSDRRSAVYSVLIDIMSSPMDALVDDTTNLFSDDDGDVDNLDSEEEKEDSGSSGSSGEEEKEESGSSGSSEEEENSPVMNRRPRRLVPAEDSEPDQKTVRPACLSATPNAPSDQPMAEAVAADAVQPTAGPAEGSELTAGPACLSATPNSPSDQPMAEAAAAAAVQPTAGTASPPEPLSGIKRTEPDTPRAEDEFFDRYLGHLLDKKKKPNDAT